MAITGILLISRMPRTASYFLKFKIHIHNIKLNKELERVKKKFLKKILISNLKWFLNQLQLNDGWKM